MADSSNLQELMDKLQEALADEAFVQELLAMEKPEDVQTALEEKDIELSLDEINQVGDAVRKVQSGEISQEQVQRLADGELSEDELEEVAGGCIIIAILFAVIVGGGSALGITAAAGGLKGW